MVLLGIGGVGTSGGGFASLAEVVEECRLPSDFIRLMVPPETLLGRLSFFGELIESVELPWSVI